MKAVVFHENGGVERLKYEDVSQPSIREDEVLVKVRACALNYLDIWARRGLRGVQLPMPHISGSDISGEVAEIGNLVDNVKIGDEVIVAPGLSCNKCEECLSGRHSHCREYKIIGYQVQGGYAQYVKAPRVNIIPKPKGLSFESAAAFPLTFLTSWHMLVTRTNLTTGETILVLGAGSGVGSVAVQIAKLLGARVIATVGSDSKIAKAKELGADKTINHSTQDVLEETRRLTGSRGVDVVFEHIGSATWSKSLKSLATGGRLVTCGATAGPLAETDIRHIFFNQLSILGCYMGGMGELLEVMKFVESGQLRPIVDRVFPLQEAGKAQRTMEERKHFGKLVLKV